MYTHILTVLNGSENNLLKVIKFHVHYNIELACIPINGSGNWVEPASHTALFKENWWDQLL